MNINPYKHNIRQLLICLFSFLIMTLISLPAKKAYSQEAYQLQELFLDAEAWFYFQDYENSLPLYLRVHQAYPEHDNVNYKIGFCYLNIDGQKHKAIPYLEEAVKNTTFNFSEEAFYEKEAPVDAIFYLANAYLINNQIDKALETYKKFEEKVRNRKSIFKRADFDYEYLKHQMDKCHTAKKLMADPVDFTAENVGIPINTPQSEYNPVVSGDGKTMVYTADKKFYTGVFMSKKQNGSWGPPINLLPQLGIDGDCQTTSISYDGTELYLYREDELDGNIYVSYYKDGSWSKIKKLGENINTKYWESHAFISADGKHLYFTSNREGGYGDLDIYRAERKDDGSWKSAKNLGKPINTEWREDTPFLTEDENTLFFSSDGNQNMGGLDIFVSHKTDGEWTDPQNIGYPLNTTDDDQFMVPFNQGKNAYYAKFNTKTGGKRDIYKYNLDKHKTIDFIEVEGIMTYQSPENKVKKNFTIHVINTKTNDTIATLEPDKEKPDYTYKTPTGENHLIYETPRLTQNEQYVISRDFNIKEEYLIPKTLAEETQKKDQPEPKINLEKDIFKASSTQDNIKIKLQLQGGNKLVVNTFQGGKLINSEEFSIEKDSFIYEYTPDEEKSRLTFNLFDHEKSILSKDVNIIMDSMQMEEKVKDKETKLDIQEKKVTLESGKKKIKIKLSLEKGSALFVETFVDDKLINTEEFNIQQEDFTYEFEPKEEKSKINFKVIDQYDNIKNQEIIISHKPIQPGLEMLLKSVGQYSLVPIAGIIGSLSLVEMSTSAILDSLRLKLNNNKINAKELDLFLMTATLLHADNPQDLYYELVRLGDEEIKNYLLKYNSSDFERKEDVIALLSMGINEGQITKNSLRKLYNAYVAHAFNPEELNQLLTVLSEIELNNILSDIGSGALDIISTEDLIKQIKISESTRKTKLITYLESLRILDGQYELSSEIRAKESEKVAKTKPKGAETVKYILIGFVGFILIAFIIFLIRRRKNNN